MQHGTLIFRYIEPKRFGIEVHRKGQEMILTLRLPDTKTLRKAWVICPNSGPKQDLEKCKRV